MSLGHPLSMQNLSLFRYSFEPRSSLHPSRLHPSRFHPVRAPVLSLKRRRPSLVMLTTYSKSNVLAPPTLRLPRSLPRLAAALSVSFGAPKSSQVLSRPRLANPATRATVLPNWPTRACVDCTCNHACDRHHACSAVGILLYTEYSCTIIGASIRILV